MKILSKIIVLSALVITMTNCSSEKKQETEKSPKVEEKKLNVQGHRGARGLMPENTIPAFLKALELGVTTLEMDLAVTKDKQLLVSHEPYMNPEMCLDSLGNEIPVEQQYANNIYQMFYEEVQSFDCGTKAHPRFPKQMKMKVSKPLLKDVVAAVNQYITANNLPETYYNIEIKSMPQGDNVFHPTPQEFSDLVVDFIQKNMNPKFVNLQSFDFRVLQYLHTTYPDMKLALLIENQDSIDQNLDSLGFVPEIYSCDFTLLSEKNIAYLQSKNMEVIPWTVNTIEDMNKMISWNIDGIITDYPDSLQSILKP